MDPIVSALNVLIEYINIEKSVREIRGFLQPVEGFALMKLAALGPGAGAIVEIGSFMGLSTVWLALGSRSTFREKITAVDHFAGSPEHQPGAEIEVPELTTEGTTFTKFREHIRRAGVETYVEPIVASSEEAVRGWNRTIRLLFIDGDHSYEESKKDFELWSPFVATGGIVAFHDIGNAPGVTSFYEQMLGMTRQYVELFRISSLGIVQRQPDAG